MKFKNYFLTLILTFFYVGILFAQSGKIHYVTVTGCGTKSGDSWENASDNIQQMINISVDGDDVWVAKGNYVSSTSLNMKGGVSVYGGFIGNENYLDQRNWELNETYISNNNASDTNPFIKNTSEIFSVLDGFYIYDVEHPEWSDAAKEWGYYEAGAVVANRGKLEIRNTIIANFTTWRGSVLNHDLLKLYNVTFKNNTGRAYQAASICCRGGTLIVDNCFFTENKTREEGGAIFFHGEQLILKNSKFSENFNLKIGGLTSYANSLCIRDYQCPTNNMTAEIENCLFENNFEGSPVFVFLRYTAIVSVSFKNCNFKNNNPGGEGYAGGIYAGYHQGVKQGSIISIEDCLFDGNSAQYGGAIITDIASTIKNSTFTNNKGTFLGGLSISNSDCTIDNVIISGNEAGFNGGGGFSGNNMTLNNLQVKNNIATINHIEYNGCGGISLDGGAVLKNSVIENNTSAKNGGGLLIGDCTISDVSIINNTAASNGGGIYIQGGNPVLKNITVSNNTAGGRGGGIYEATENFLIENSTISNNKASSGGGGMISEMGREIEHLGNIKDCIFINNETSGSGGGILLSNGKVIIENTSFLSNKAANGGGISKGLTSDFFSEIKNCIIKGNYASNDGGGIYTGQTDFYINNSLISGNKAENNGGGIFSRSYMKIVNSTISGNNAAAGGGIYNSSYELTINNSIIKGNENSDCFTPPYHYGFSASNCLIGNINPVGLNNFDDRFGNINPLFVDPVDASLAPTISGDYSLQASSPLINKGSNDFLNYNINFKNIYFHIFEFLTNINTDLDNNPRIYDNGVVDIGAYEYQGDQVIVPVSSITLDKSEITMNYIDAKLIPKVLPENATNKTIIWSSENSDVAAVSETGHVIAVSIGTTYIVATTEDGNKVAKCKVTVNQNSKITIHRGDDITKETKSFSVQVGRTDAYMYADVFPEFENPSGSDIIWTSSNSNNISVAGGISGWTTPPRYGATINPIEISQETVTTTIANTNVSASCLITVGPKVTNATLSKTSTTIKAGKTDTLKIYKTPENSVFGSGFGSYTSDNNIAWSSWLSGDGNEDYVIVHARLTAGTCDLVVYWGSNYITCSVTVDDEELNSDATLNSLFISNGMLSPAFNASTLNYSANVPHYINDITIYADANNYEASVTGTGEKFLNYGLNTFEVIVTSKNGKTQLTYTIDIFRESPLPPPTIITTSLPSGTRGAYYSAKLEAVGTDVYWYDFSGLDFGLRLDGNGDISGIPYTSGTFTFIAHAQNEAGWDRKEISIVINEPDPADAPIITTASLPDGELDKAYNATLSATGGTPMRWLLLNEFFPDGLYLDDITGEILGIPTKEGMFSFNISAFNYAGSDIKSFTIEIKDVTSIETTNNPSMKIYANEKNLIIESEILIKSVEVFNINGQILKKMDSGNNYVMISDLPINQVLIVIATTLSDNIVRKTIVL